MAEKRSDQDMVIKLLDRMKLVVAVSEEIPTQSKLQLQPLIKELMDGLSLPEDAQDRPRMSAYVQALLDESDEDPDVVALVVAMRRFASFL